jgi:hypothetical protein
MDARGDMTGGPYFSAEMFKVFCRKFVCNNEITSEGNTFYSVVGNTM